MNKGKIELTLSGGHMTVETSGLNVDEEGKLRFLDSILHAVTEDKEEREELIDLYREVDDLGGFEMERTKIDLRPLEDLLNGESEEETE